MVSFISGDVGLAPAFKEPEESMSTSPQATILAMEQQQNRAEVSHDPGETAVGGMSLLASPSLVCSLAVAFGGAAPDCGADLRDGGKGQPAVQH